MWNRGTRVRFSHINFHFDRGGYGESFYCAIKPGKIPRPAEEIFGKIEIYSFELSPHTALRVSQLFGLFPVNFEAENPKEIQFCWRSWRAAVSVIFIVCVTFTALTILKVQVQQGPLTASNIAGVIFFSSCAFVAIQFLRVALSLKEFMVLWTQTEAHFTANAAYTLPRKPMTIRRKFKAVTFGYLLLALVEHLLFHSSKFYDLFYDMKVCNQSDIDYIKTYTKRNLGFIVDNLPFEYNNIVGLLMQYLILSYTFAWNFLDLFIILVSLGIINLFEKVNWRVKNMRGLLIGESVWAEIRFHHVQVQELLAYVNSLIGVMVVFACFMDGYFILLQLLKLTT